MNYFYNKQFKKHIVRFMEVFRGTEVRSGLDKNGNIQSIEVPIIYGSMDRVAASLASNNTQNLPIRLPMMSAYLSNISMANDLYKGIDTIKASSYTPKGGVFPDDTRTIYQIMPTPFKLSMDLYIYSNNLDTLLQILEQTLILFNPKLQIQVSDALYDGGKSTTIELTSISNGENFPIGTDRRTILYTLNFEMIVYLTVPAEIKNDRIRDINIRISGISDQDSIPYELTELDINIKDALT
jgi:hypothetical protein